MSVVTYEIGIDGLSKILAIIRTTEVATELPAEYQAVIEWGRIR